MEDLSSGNTLCTYWHLAKMNVFQLSLSSPGYFLVTNYFPLPLLISLLLIISLTFLCLHLYNYQKIPILKRFRIADCSSKCCGLSWIPYLYHLFTCCVWNRDVMYIPVMRWSVGVCVGHAWLLSTHLGSVDRASCLVGSSRYRIDHWAQRHHWNIQACLISKKNNHNYIDLMHHWNTDWSLIECAIILQQSMPLCDTGCALSIANSKLLFDLYYWVMFFLYFSSVCTWLYPILL